MWLDSRRMRHNILYVWFKNRRTMVQIRVSRSRLRLWWGVRLRLGIGNEVPRSNARGLLPKQWGVRNNKRRKGARSMWLPMEGVVGRNYRSKRLPWRQDPKCRDSLKFGFLSQQLVAKTDCGAPAPQRLFMLRTRDLLYNMNSTYHYSWIFDHEIQIISDTTWISLAYDRYSVKQAQK